MTDAELADRLRRTRRVFLVCHFLRWLPAGLLLPVLVLVLTERGLSLTQVGYVFATYGAVTALLELPTGALADTLGRKPLLLLATVFDAGLLVGLLFSQHTWQFMIAATAGGVGRALLSGPLESWYVDAARQLDPAVELRPALSGAGVAESAAIGVGALLSAVLPTVASGLPLDGVVSMLTIPLLAGLLAQGASFLALLVLVGESGRPHQSARRVRAAVAHVPGAIRSGANLAVSTRDLRLIFGASFVVVFGLVSVETLWQPRFADLLGGTDLALRVNGYVIVGMSLAAAGGSWLANHLPSALSDRPPRAAAVALLIAAGAMVGLATAGHVVAAVAAFLVLYLAIAAAGVLEAELLHERVPTERRATVVSMLSLSQESGNLLSSLVLARVANAAGIPLAWSIAAVTFVVAAGLTTAISNSRAPVAHAHPHPERVA